MSGTQIKDYRVDCWINTCTNEPMWGVSVKVVGVRKWMRVCDGIKASIHDTKALAEAEIAQMKSERDANGFKKKIPEPCDTSHGFHIFKDGNAWCAVGPRFINLQESLAAFGDTPRLASENLRTELEARGYSTLPNFDAFMVQK